MESFLTVREIILSDYRFGELDVPFDFLSQSHQVAFDHQQKIVKFPGGFVCQGRVEHLEDVLELVVDTKSPLDFELAFESYLLGILD